MIKKLFFNLVNSINGIKVAFKEHSFVTELLGGIVLIPYVLLSDLTDVFKSSIIIVYLLLLAFELLNAAIEKLCDKITKEIDNDIKIIKDLASASVFIVLIVLIILIIFTFFV